MGSRTWVVAIAVLLATLIGGCTTSTIVEWTDEEGAEITAEKRAVLDKFRSNLADPDKKVSKGPGPQSTYEFDVKVPKILTLQDAIRIATRYNRSFIGRRESYFLSMLSLGLTRHNFLKPQFSGSVSWNGSVLENAKLAESTRISLSGSKLLPSGGSLSASANANQGTAEDAGTGRRFQGVGGGASLSFSQPLLRGRGRTIAWEGLTQAERSAIYTARSFETFRQTFAVDVIDRFFSLVSQFKGLDNVKRNVANQEYALKQAQAAHLMQRGTQQSVFRAQQSVRDAKNAELEAQQNWALAVDRFKIFLGLPLSAEFTIDTKDLPPIGKFDPEKGRYEDLIEILMVEQEAVDAALHNRLDMATQRDQLEDTVRGVHISRNALLPSFDFSASVSTGVIETASFRRSIDFSDTAGSIGLSLELPLDKKAERNAYRSALIGLASAKRNLRESQDNLILGVRDSLRRLKQVRQQIQNDEENIVTIERAALRADLDFRSGAGSNRDLTEALQDLALRRNQLLDRYVTYYTTILRFKQQLGLLFVDKEGRIVE